MKNSEQSTIPLFPLTRVLFPKMILRLHIFEERYKEMISTCLADGTDFGIICSNNLESGEIGTIATIEQVTKIYEDGRMDILVAGKDRFKVSRIIHTESYLQGEISIVKDFPDIQPAQAQIEELLDLYKTYIARLGLKQNYRNNLDSIIESINDEQELSYIIAQTIGLNHLRQQELLSKLKSEKRLSFLRDELIKQDVIHNQASHLFENTDFDPELN